MKKLLLVVGLLLLGMQVSDASPETVYLAAENSWPPFAKEDGSGISKSIVQKAYAAVGRNVEFVVVPYARGLKMAQQGQVDGVFNVTKQASTEAMFLFGDEPILQVTASYYYPPNSKANFQDVENIPHNASLALIIGYEYGDEYEIFRNRFKEVRVKKQRQIVQLLLGNKVDAAIMFDEVAAFTLREMGMASSAIRKGNVNHISDIYVAFSKSRKGSEEKMRDLDRGLKLLKIQARK